MAKHDSLLLSIIGFSSAAFACTVMLSVLASTSQIKGLFLSTTSNISSRYKLEITPADWTFWMWPVTHLWNGLWVMYVLSTICRRNAVDYTYCAPKVHPIIFFVLWFLANLFNSSWLFLWDREYFAAAIYMIILPPICCCFMLGISYKNCFNHATWLSINSSTDVWCIRILVHNGLATYVTWTFISALINFGMVLKYDARLKDSCVSSIVMYLVLFGLLFWFFLEIFVFEEYVRYTITVYPVATVVLFGIFLRKGVPEGRLSQIDITIAVVLAVSIVACFLRLILLFLCDNLRPLIQVENYKSLNSVVSTLDHSTSGEASQETTNAGDEIHTAES